MKVFATILNVLLLAASASAAGTRGLWYSNGGLQKICTNLKTADGGCIRYVQGFDVTGVVTEVDLTFPAVKNVCDCVQQCLNRKGTCANWVYKFSTPDSVKTGHRTCTLYSNFNLPADVVIDVNVQKSKNVQLLQAANNPQAGGLVPQAFKDRNLTSTPDDQAYSGALWTLADGRVLC
jgi:hypothetical protein